MKRNLLLLFLLSMGMTGYCETITITASDAGMVFSPNNDNVTINFEDIVHFVIGSSHTATEVSQETWDASGTASNGGFSVGQGQTKDVTNLSVGQHWYVCQFHVGSGMKAIITVTALGVNDFQVAKNFYVFPNPSTDVVNVKTNVSLVDVPYTVIDEGGRIISDGKFDDSTFIDIHQLNSGIYFLQVGDDRRQILKVIKR